MKVQQRVVDYLDNELSLAFKNTGVSNVVRKALADKLAETAIEFKANKKDRELVTVKDKGKKQPPEIFHYKPIAAAGLVASFIGGIVGASNWAVLGCAVVYCGASFQRVRSQVSPAEGVLFWIICNSKNSCTSRDEARQLFNEACKDCEGITAEDFTPALNSLTRLGFIKESNNKFEVVERIYRLNTAHIFES
jgi:hypothetical protein